MRVYLLFVFVGIFAASFGVNAKEKPALRPAKKNVSATKKGFDVAKRADAKDAGFGSYSANAKMELKDKRGKPRTSRSFHFKFKEVPSDADKTITKFLSPANVKGTILLTHGHKDRDDDQWIYLSALKRDKRILSSGQTGAFLGSEFSFEDMRSPIIEKFRYKYLRSEMKVGRIATL